MSVMDDERSPLLVEHSSTSPPAILQSDNPQMCESATSVVNDAIETESTVNVYTVLPVLLLGMLVANIDETLVLASSSTIASEFNALSRSGWLVASYSLSICAVQPMYGRFSEEFGRKAMVLTAYSFFSVGCCISAVGQSYVAVLAGRALAGMGGAGMFSLASIILTDMVPVRSVAGWQSIFRLAGTTGRSIGGPLGGLFTDKIGWRWSFFIQCPLMILAGILVAWRLPSETRKVKVNAKNADKSPLARLDLLGAALLASTIVTFLLALNVLGAAQSSGTPLALALVFGTILSGFGFVRVERRRGDGAIYPLRLFHYREVLTAYCMACFQYSAQYSFLFTIPPYFQVTKSVSAKTAGSYLLPAIIGNTIGSLFGGFLIHRTGRYKLLTLMGILAGFVSYFIIIIQWRGHTSPLELGYSIPPAIGAAIVSTTSFMHLTAGLPAEDLAIAGTGLFTSHNIGSAAGISIMTAVLQRSLLSQLRVKLIGKHHAEKIIARSTESLEYVMGLKGELRAIVVDAYVHAFTLMHGVILLLSSVALIASLFVKEHRF